jgi:hypothetical protein
MSRSAASRGGDQIIEEHARAQLIAAWAAAGKRHSTTLPYKTATDSSTFALSWLHALPGSDELESWTNHHENRRSDGGVSAIPTAGDCRDGAPASAARPSAQQPHQTCIPSLAAPSLRAQEGCRTQNKTLEADWEQAPPLGVGHAPVAWAADQARERTRQRSTSSSAVVSSGGGRRTLQRVDPSSWSHTSATRAKLRARGIVQAADPDAAGQRVNKATPAAELPHRVVNVDVSTNVDVSVPTRDTRSGRGGRAAAPLASEQDATERPVTHTARQGC